MSAEWVRVDLDAVEKYGADAAVVLGLIAYRCNPTGEWEATVEEMIEETRLTLAKVRASLRVLRDTGAVVSRRADRFRPLLTWSVSAGQTVNNDLVITRITDRSSSVTNESDFSSYTENQELPLVVPTVEKPARKPARRAVQLPSDFRPKPEHFTLAASLGVHLPTEGPKFTDYHQARGSTMKDWDAALRTWIRNAASFAAARQGPKSADVPAAVWATEQGTVQLPPPRTDPFVVGGF